MKKISKTLSILVIILWAVYLFIDYSLQEVLIKAVSEQTGTYGESYGPLLFFRPLFLYLALAITGINSILLWIAVSSNYGKTKTFK